MEPELVIRRRRLSAEDLADIRRLIAAEGHRGRSYLSQRLCQIWDWRQANGRFRQIACRDLLRQLQAKGLIQLPPRLSSARRPGYRNRVPPLPRLETAPLQAAPGSLRQQIVLELAQSRPSLQWFNGLIATYHYLGHQQPTGAQLKYLAFCQDRSLAALSFGPAAFQLAPRDQFIGWTPALRRQRLDWVVNQDRFLLLPWIQVPGLASWLLQQALQRLRADWQAVYEHDLALVETFVQKDRFSGCSYAAAQWWRVGETQGRGRNDRANQQAAPIKTIWLYPLRPDFRAVLCA